VKSAHDTLLTLGVSPPNVRIVIENLIFAGDLIVRPGGSLIRPLYRIGSRGRLCLEVAIVKQGYLPSRGLLSAAPHCQVTPLNRD